MNELASVRMHIPSPFYVFVHFLVASVRVRLTQPTHHLSQTSMHATVVVAVLVCAALAKTRPDLGGERCRVNQGRECSPSETNILPKPVGSTFDLDRNEMLERNTFAVKVHASLFYNPYVQLIHILDSLLTSSSSTTSNPTLLRWL